MKNAAGEGRTHDLRVMRLTRCQLRYCHLVAFVYFLVAVLRPGSAIVEIQRHCEKQLRMTAVGFEPTPLRTGA